MTGTPEGSAHRARLEALADTLLEAVVQWTDPGGSRVLPPGPLGPRRGTAGTFTRPAREVQSALQRRLGTPAGRRRAAANGLEGFARTSLLAVHRARHAPPARREELLGRVHRGLLSGTARGGSGVWPAPTDRTQAVVEAGLLATALFHSRQQLWDRLTPREQAQVTAWMEPAVTAAVPPNNWLLFGVLVERFLSAVGRAPSTSSTAGRLRAVEAMYRGDGWYSDGAVRNFDYYSGWGFHVDLVDAALMAGHAGEAELERHRERLRAYLEQAQHLFDGEGRPVAVGRSLTYRHAVLAPFWSGVLVDATPLPSGRTRRLAVALSDSFAADGVPDRRGLLPLGWRRGIQVPVQVYSGAASPYWAAKGFAGLLLPADHPEWADVPVPVDRPSTVLLRVPALVVATSSDGSVCRLVNHGLDARPPDPEVDRTTDPGYDAFAYSSRTAPPPGGGAANQLLLVAADGRRAARTAAVPCGAATERLLTSSFVALGQRVQASSVVLDDGWEVRVAHLVDGPGAAEVEAGGFLLTGGRPVRGDPAGREATVAGGGLRSSVRGVAGWDVAATAVDRAVLPGRRGAATPVLRRGRPWGVGEPLVWVVGLHEVEPPSGGPVPTPSVVVADDGVRVEHGDVVVLVRPPEPQEPEIGRPRALEEGR